MYNYSFVQKFMEMVEYTNLLMVSEEELDRLLLVVRLVLDCSSTVMVVVVGLLGSCRGVVMRVRYNYIHCTV